jgi:site-specific recombinase XerD
MATDESRGGGGQAERSKPKRYPDYLMPFAGAAEERYKRFTELREELLADYCYNTARAYWSDLDDIYLWAEDRGKDVLALSEKDLRQYVALLRRRKYSESTIRRRRVVYGLLRDVP